MRPALDYSKELRRMLADGKTLDAALAELRSSGVSICDCIVSVRSLRRCDIAEAKRTVETSPAWSDIRNVTEEILEIWSESQDENMG